MGQPITFSGPDAEFKDVERRKLMTELLRAFRKLEILNGASAGTYKSRIDPLGWSLLWLSDIESLRDIIEDFKRSPWPTLSIIRSMISLATFEHNWVTSRRSTDSPPEHIDDTCLQRDGKCILTLTDDLTEACQILPPSLEARKYSPKFCFWGVLYRFWGETVTIAELDNYIREKTVQNVENYILLTAEAHVYWEELLFALEPLYLSNDRRTMLLKFYWLCPDKVENVQLSTAVLPEDTDEEFLVEPPSLSSDIAQEASIPPGQIITLTTEDPDAMPLPDPRILRLQWLLHRTLALAKAAGYQEEEVF